jgi:hypothetical protein
MDNSMTFEFCRLRDLLDDQDMRNLYLDLDEHFEQDQNVDLKNRIGNYTTNKGPRNKVATMRLVQKDSEGDQRK